MQHQGKDAAGAGYLTARKVWERYDVTERTLYRWVNAPEVAFPQPIRIGSRRYFSLADLEAWERKRAGVAA